MGLGGGVKLLKYFLQARGGGGGGGRGNLEGGGGGVGVTWKPLWLHPSTPCPKRYLSCFVLSAVFVGLYGPGRFGIVAS